MGVSAKKIGRNRIQTYENIRFIDDEDDASLYDPSDEANKCARGSTFCERVDNYPSAEFNSILKEANKYIFGTDLVAQISIGNRFGGVEDEERLCSSHKRLVYPRVGLTRDNTWRYIVNQSNYTQGVLVEECRYRNAFVNKIYKNVNVIFSLFSHTRQCHKTVVQSLPLGYNAQCKQKFVYRQLVAIDEEGNTIKDFFMLPSCCECVIFPSEQWNRGY